VRGVGLEGHRVVPFCGFRHARLSHSATARLRRLTGVCGCGLRPPARGHPHLPTRPGIDFSEPAVQRARSIASTLRLDNVEVRVGDVHDVDLQALGSAFDLAYARLFLVHQRDPARTMQRIAALLRPRCASGTRRGPRGRRDERLLPGARATRREGRRLRLGDDTVLPRAHATHAAGLKPRAAGGRAHRARPARRRAAEIRRSRRSRRP
jgi:SAM-dependent methyltransferase